MNNNYYCIITENDPALSEVIIALLGELPFDTFEEDEQGVRAFIRVKDFNSEVEAELSDISANLNFNYKKEEIAARNWNEEWESNFKSLQIDDFCAIRAEFHEAIPKVQYEIVIQPNMAFGTGHHETTHLMIEQMRGIDFSSKRVFDYGCGTGILAILAVKMGATSVTAVDNELPAYESSISNIIINNTPEVDVVYGTLSEVDSSAFDVILANINRNIIVSSLSVLYQKLASGGLIIMSGFLNADEIHIKNELVKFGLVHQNTNQKGDWISVLAYKAL